MGVSDSERSSDVDWSPSSATTIRFSLASVRSRAGSVAKSILRARQSEATITMLSALQSEATIGKSQKPQEPVKLVKVSKPQKKLVKVSKPPKPVKLVKVSKPPKAEKPVKKVGVWAKLSKRKKPVRIKRLPFTKLKTLSGFSRQKKNTKSKKTVAKKRRVKKIKFLPSPEPIQNDPEPILNEETRSSELRKLDERSDVLRQRLERLHADKDELYSIKGWNHFAVKKMNRLAKTLSQKLAKISMKRYELGMGSSLATSPEW